MKRFLFSLITLFCFLIASSHEQDSSLKLPALNKPRVRNIDVKNIVIDLRFDWQKKQACGTAAITLSLFETSNKILLDAGMLTINSIYLHNGTSLKFNYDGGDKNDNLEIMLDRFYKSNEEVTVKIDYHSNWINETDPGFLSGNNGKGLRFSEPTTNDPTKPKEIWSIGDPESNRYWFPCYDAPDDLRTTEFIATLDNKLAVISNGKLVEKKTNPDGTNTFYYKTNTPYANHLTSFVVGEYADTEKMYDEITLHNFCYANEKKSVEATVVRLPDMIKFYSEVTGLKYPFSNYSQVFVQDIGSFTSNNCVATITENMVDDEPTHADFFYLWDLTEAEALAQQWFGNYLTATDWNHVWLNKSFAHYFNELYNKQKNGSEEFLLYQHAFDQAVYLGDWNAPYRHPVVTQHYDDVYQFTTDNYATTRGSLVLNMLHKHLGEEKWWKAIKRYVKSNAGKSVTTENFIAAVEEVSGEQMDWFFDQWLYKMGHPVFVVTKKFDTEKKVLTVGAKQTQTVDPKEQYPQVNFFKGKIDIEIDGKVEQVWLEAKAENNFTFSLSQPPKLVNFDFESTWIKEITFEKSLDELCYQFQNSKDILAKQYAMIELAKLASDEKTSGSEKTKIETELRNVVLSNAYWRLRNGAMSQLRNLTGASAGKMNEATRSMLLTVIKNDQSWVKASAIGFLGLTRDTKYTQLYLNALTDKSDRVINSAAIALGKTKSPAAFDALSKLVNKPSMKSQSLLSALAGLKELGDPRGFDIAFKALSDLNLPRWRLPDGSVWDFRIFAAQTITSLGRASEVYPLIFERFKKAMAENDLNGTLNNILIINILADPRGQEAFELLKARYKDDANIMVAVENYENQFKAAIKQK